MMYAFILIPLTGAFLWRIRGGLLNSIFGRENPYGMNDTFVRIIWAVGMTGLLYAFHPLPLWREAALLLSLFVSSVVGWYNLPLLPRHIGTVLGLSLDGLVRFALAALALLSPWPMLAGVLLGPSYWLAARFPAKPGSWEFWGEWLYGAVVGFCLALVV